MLLVSSLNDVFAQKNDNSEMEISDDDRGNTRNVIEALYETDDGTEFVGTPQTKSRDFPRSSLDTGHISGCRSCD